jgi:hypothetical protein
MLGPDHRISLDAISEVCESCTSIERQVEAVRCAQLAAGLRDTVGLNCSGARLSLICSRIGVSAPAHAHTSRCVAGR